MYSASEHLVVFLFCVLFVWVFSGFFLWLLFVCCCCFVVVVFWGANGGGGLIQDILSYFNDLVLVHHALHPVLLLQ